MRWLAGVVELALGVSQAAASEGQKPMEASHISALQVKHAGLDKQLHDEMAKPAPDVGAIKALKLRKLRIKDAIFKH